MNESIYQASEGRAGSAETSKSKSTTFGMQEAALRAMCVEIGHEE